MLTKWIHQVNEDSYDGDKRITFPTAGFNALPLITFFFFLAIQFRIIESSNENDHFIVFLSHHIFSIALIRMWFVFIHVSFLYSSINQLLPDIICNDSCPKFRMLYTYIQTFLTHYKVLLFCHNKPYPMVVNERGQTKPA